ncbi:hypothetical protein V2J09_003487 [Rumex salicifolius]
MVAFPVIARAIGHHCRRASKSYPQRSPNFSNNWQFHATRRLILQSLNKSVSLNRLSGNDTGIIELNLDRPAAKNAIGKDMLRGLQTSLETVEKDLYARVLLIRSLVPKVFCAGADLKNQMLFNLWSSQEKMEMSASENHFFINSIRSTFAHLQELHLPTIAVIEGAALGGGFELALSCDIRISGEDAYMGLPETGLAISPGAGGTQNLPRLVGRSIAKELIFTGRRVSGKDALLLGKLWLWKLKFISGLVNYCVPAGEAHQKALEMAREISQKGSMVVRMAKQAVDKGMNVHLASAWKVEEECYKQTLHTKDRLEGLAAFAEKRKPIYNGE